MRYLFLTFLIVLTSLTSVFSQPVSFTDSIYSIQDSILIPTKSGIPISAIIVRKTENVQPLPAVLFYTTYYQGKGDAILGKRSADRDYVGVVVYARGIRTNLNDYTPYEHEGTDIYDIIDWISKQSWCNGKIGMLGGSYTGFSQWATAKHLHPALKTIVPQVAIMPGFDTPMENNVLSNISLSWPYENIYKSKSIRENLFSEWFEKGNSYRTLDSLAGVLNPIFQKWLQHPGYDAYWKSLVPTPQEYAKINIPVLSTTGYYDGAQLSSLQYFKLHNQFNKDADHYFVIGPYNHWGGQRNASPTLMGYRIDSVANISMQDLAYQWLDYILKGKPKPGLLKDKVNFEVMGKNEWKHVASLNKASNDTLTFYLHDKTLTNKKPDEKSYVSQSVNFKDRKTQNNYYTASIILDTLDASGGLIFTTQPFEENFSINGSFFGNLAAAINKEDMDFSLALYERMPNGKYFYLTRYLGRASYAKDHAKRQLLQPNKKENIPFTNTRFISRYVKKGSQLVIVLISTNIHTILSITVQVKK